MTNNLKEEPKKRQPRVFLAVALILTGVLILLNGVSSLLDDRVPLIAPRGRISVEVVSTDTTRSQGLSGRTELGDNEGMLFEYGNEAVERCFWMKDMNFAIDMIWLNANKRVVHIQDSVHPDTYPESFCPDEPSQYILEVPSGRAEQLGIDKDGVELRF